MAELREINIGGRQIPLYYSVYEMIAIQQDIGCTVYQLKEEVFGLRQVDEDDPTSTTLDVVTDPEKTRKLGVLLRILGNAGLEEDGKEPDLTDKWILRHMRPPMIIVYALAALNVIIEGNMVEKQDADEGPVDEVLEEQQAKKQRGK